MHHDLSLFFDEDDRAYIIYGNGTLYITELTLDSLEIRPDGVNQILVETPTVTGLNCEGSHFYKIKGNYYLFLINWPANGSHRRLEWCYRCDTLLGHYEGKKLVDSSMGYYNNGVAQGGIFDTVNGDWYAMLFQDHFAAGRFPVILSVTWKDGWLLMGKDGSGEAEETLEIKLPAEKRVAKLYGSDEFNASENRLPLFWQWNHNPDNGAWSLTERPGWLRLKNKNPAETLVHARNILTQRIPFPWCACETKLDMHGMQLGDTAGISAFQSNYAYVGARMEETGKRVVVFGIKSSYCIIPEKKIELDQDCVWLKIIFDFQNGPEKANDLAYLMYSTDGEKWNIWDTVLRMEYTRDHFVGYRIALYSYNKAVSGGFADFNKATPLSIAAFFTAADTESVIRVSKGCGRMYSGVSVRESIKSASAWAAAICMGVFMSQAWTSRAPLKIPGNASTLFI